MSAQYPDKRLVIDTLAEVAKSVAHESSANHPGDIVNAMICALEGAAEAITVLWKSGNLKLPVEFDAS